jgi:VanZ family protein
MDRLPPERPTLLRAWWPVAVWVGVIAFESTDYLSSANTGSVLYSLVTRIFGQVNLYDFLIWHYYLRKAGHVVGYGILCLLLLRGWRATLHISRSFGLIAALLSWSGTALIASLDEWHQTFIPSRTGTIRDVILDSVAGLLFLVLAQVWLHRSRAVELGMRV